MKQDAVTEHPEHPEHGKQEQTETPSDRMKLTTAPRLRTGLATRIGYQGNYAYA